ncbi:MAG: BrnT family toxin [Minwuia sp.]|nr:BrnT family toxin [Minwuia sp.]
MKNRTNIEKHRIAFDAIRRMQWELTLVFELQHVDGEERQVVVGPVDDRLVLAVLTERKKTTRIISMRHATQREIERWRQELSNA